MVSKIFFLNVDLLSVLMYLITVLQNSKHDTRKRRVSCISIHTRSKNNLIHDTYTIILNLQFSIVVQQNFINFSHNFAIFSQIFFKFSLKYSSNFLNIFQFVCKFSETFLKLLKKLQNFLNLIIILKICFYIVQNSKTILMF